MQNKPRLGFLPPKSPKLHGTRSIFSAKMDEKYIQNKIFINVLNKTNCQKPNLLSLNTSFALQSKLTEFFRNSTFQSLGKVKKHHRKSKNMKYLRKNCDFIFKTPRDHQDMTIWRCLVQKNFMNIFSWLFKLSQTRGVYRVKQNTDVTLWKLKLNPKIARLCWLAVPKGAKIVKAKFRKAKNNCQLCGIFFGFPTHSDELYV